MSPANEPTSPEGIADIIKSIADGKRVSLVEAMAPDDSSIPIRLNHLNKIIDYPFDDMTITVQAGMTCTELAGHLAQHNQQLPIDVIDPDSTVGELVAGNRFGPRIAGYGTVRDYLIGVQAVDGTGRVFRSGGRVVKNVAGYDLCRLMIGSRGRLAVITECTFKLKPKPETTAARQMQFNSRQQLELALKALNQSQARPVIVDLHAVPAVDCHSMLLVAAEGSAASCDWQLNQIESECKAATTTRLTESDIADYCASPENFRQNDQLQVKTLRSIVAAVADQLQKRNISVSGHAADGILNCCDSEGIRSDLRNVFTEEQLQFVDAAPSFSAPSHPMNESIIKAFDPHSVFAANE